MLPANLSPNIKGAFCAIGATACFSINDVSFKFLSEVYPLHEIVFIRSLLAITFFAIFIIAVYWWMAVHKNRKTVD